MEELDTLAQAEIARLGGNPMLVRARACCLCHVPQLQFFGQLRALYTAA